MPITADQISELKTASIDFPETVRLKSKFARLREQRNPFFLTESEFDEILHWKLRSQYGRQKAYRSANTDEIICAITNTALNIRHEDADYEIDLHFKILTSLRGIGVPVASAILSLVFPDKYAVIDFRGWRQVFDDEKSFFTLSDYKKYLKEIRRISGELGWLPEEVDLAIWEYDRRYGKSRITSR